MNPIFPPPPPPPLKETFFSSGPYLSRGGLFLKTIFTILTSSILGLCWVCFCCGLSDCCLVFDETCMAVGLLLIVKCVTIGLVFVETCNSWLGVCWDIRDSWPGVCCDMHGCWLSGWTKPNFIAIWHSLPSQTWQMEKHLVRAVHVSAL